MPVALRWYACISKSYARHTQVTHMTVRTVFHLLLTALQSKLHILIASFLDLYTFKLHFFILMLLEHSCTLISNWVIPNKIKICNIMAKTSQECLNVCTHTTITQEKSYVRQAAYKPCVSGLSYSGENFKCVLNRDHRPSCTEPL